MLTDFNLVGLNKAKVATLELLHSDRESFHAKIDMSQEQFDTLWEFCSNNWESKIIGVIKHEDFHPRGTPKNPIMVDYRQWDINLKRRSDAPTK